LIGGGEEVITCEEGLLLGCVLVGLVVFGALLVGFETVGGYGAAVVREAFGGDLADATDAA
jgi:hypothetical protein